MPELQIVDANIEQSYRHWYLDHGMRASQYKRIALKLASNEHYPWATRLLSHRGVSPYG